MEELTKTQHRVAEALYKQADPGDASTAEDAGGTSSAGDGGKAQEDVIDAEVVEEEKK
jgi:molecular chaperone DnaK